jgi:endonuclease III
VDSWAQDKRVATFLRQDGSKKYLRIDDPLPSRYKMFNVVRSQSVVTGPHAPQCLAVIVDEADLSSLAAVAIARDEGENTSEIEKVSEGELLVKTVVRQPQLSQNHKHAVVQGLLGYRSQQETGGPFTGNKDADRFLRRNPFAFLMAASIDRGALAEAVWEIPFLLNKKLGHLEPQVLSQMSIAQLEEVLRSLNRRPRFPRQSAQTITSLSRLVFNQFHGNAASMWEDKEPSAVVQTLEQIWGVGPGIAHMIVRILVDEFSYEPGPEGLRQIDVKPDTHIIRVFCRTGLTQNRSGKACVEAARQLYPEFPGLLDWPAWEIGRTWCHEHSPECMKCPLYNICPRIDVRIKGKQS